MLGAVLDVHGSRASQSLFLLFIVAGISQLVSFQHHVPFSSIVRLDVDKLASLAGTAEEESELPSFFIRNAVPAEMGSVSNLLTESFFGGKTNPLKYQWERLITYLSLESTFPSSRSNAKHVMLVACRAIDGKVVGFAELEDRDKPKELSERNDTIPYMFNVAVDKRWRRLGLARALVFGCEEQVRMWGKSEIFLKVRTNNQAAISMYEKLGYVLLLNATSYETRSGEAIVTMTKEFDSKNLQ